MKILLLISATVFTITGLIGIISDKGIEGVLWLILSGIFMLLHSMEEIKNTNGE